MDQNKCCSTIILTGEQLGHVVIIQVPLGGLDYCSKKNSAVKRFLSGTKHRKPVKLHVVTFSVLVYSAPFYLKKQK